MQKKINAVKNLVLIGLVLLFTASCAVGSKKSAQLTQETDSTTAGIFSYNIAHSQFAGAQYAYRTSTKQHWRGFNSLTEKSRMLPTININASMSFSSDYNLVTIRVETKPVGTSAPEDFGFGDIYTRTFRYEVRDNELIIDKKITYNISSDYKVLTSTMDMGNAFPPSFTRRY